jgi:hypothetical protein
MSSSPGSEALPEWMTAAPMIEVDVPVLGDLSSAEKITPLLGGKERLDSMVTGQTDKLRFRFRPWDVAEIPLEGPHTAVKRVLVRVRRKRQRGWDEAVAEPVGVINSSVEFGPADFQFIPRDPVVERDRPCAARALELFRKAREGGAGGADSPALDRVGDMIPFSFLTGLGAHPWDAKENPLVSAKKRDGPFMLAQSRRKSVKEEHTLKYEDMCVAPTEPTAGAVANADPATKERLVAVFEKCPVWSLGALQKEVENKEVCGGVVAVVVVDGLIAVCAAPHHTPVCGLQICQWSLEEPVDTSGIRPATPPRCCTVSNSLLPYSHLSLRLHARPPRVPRPVEEATLREVV